MISRRASITPIDQFPSSPPPFHRALLVLLILILYQAVRPVIDFLFCFSVRLSHSCCCTVKRAIFFINHHHPVFMGFPICILYTLT